MFLDIIFCLFIFNLLWLLAINPISSSHKRDNYRYFFRQVYPEAAKKRAKSRTSRNDFRRGQAP